MTNVSVTCQYLHVSYLINYGTKLLSTKEVAKNLKKLTTDQQYSVSKLSKMISENINVSLSKHTYKVILKNWKNNNKASQQSNKQVPGVTSGNTSDTSSSLFLFSNPPYKFKKPRCHCPLPTNAKSSILLHRTGDKDLPYSSSLHTHFLSLPLIHPPTRLYTYPSLQLQEFLGAVAGTR